MFTLFFIIEIEPEDFYIKAAINKYCCNHSSTFIAISGR